MYKRISIIGGCGSGKTTLAKKLSTMLNLPVLYLDSVNYNENWEKVDEKKRDQIILNKMQEEKWVIDGNYYTTLKERLEKSDLVIWLDYTTFALLKGVILRYIKLNNKYREEMNGCKEKFELSFLKYVFNFRKNKRIKLINATKEIANDKLLIFKNRKKLKKWLKTIVNN